MAKPSPSHAGSPELSALGQAIRAARLALGWSQERLAEEAGVDRSYMGGIERGEHNLTVVSLVRISAALDLSVGDLFARVDV